MKRLVKVLLFALGACAAFWYAAFFGIVIATFL